MSNGGVSRNRLFQTIQKNNPGSTLNRSASLRMWAHRHLHHNFQYQCDNAIRSNAGFMHIMRKEDREHAGWEPQNAAVAGEFHHVLGGIVRLANA